MSEPNERVVPIHTRRGGGGACPLCKKPSQADFRPFCSKRCADLDLSRWLNGVYVPEFYGTVNLHIHRFAVMAGYQRWSAGRVALDGLVLVHNAVDPETPDRGSPQTR